MRFHMWVKENKRPLEFDLIYIYAKKKKGNLLYSETCCETSVLIFHKKKEGFYFIIL
jgi:hypothetical protein